MASDTLQNNFYSLKLDLYASVLSVRLFRFLRLCDCPEMKVIECFLAIKVDFAMHRTLELYGCTG